MSESSIDLYTRAERIYPREVDGVYSRLRRLSAWVLLGLFYSVAWLSWDGQQLVLFDLPGRKFHVFGLTFWPQDFIFLTGLLMLAALALFLFTTLAGRLWCGFACPQTVWTEVFLYLEKLAQGPARRRRKLAQAPWSSEKIRGVALKQILFVSFALWTGLTFVGYFTPIRDLVPRFFQWQLGGWELFWVFFYGLATYGNAGYLREQVCKYMCPYARFQGAMFDRDTLIVTYDEARGEPRGARSRKADPAELGLGDCIDCTLCVQVCPTGIDIRDGQQYECITCAACIDACNDVMAKMDYPPGLIRFSTQNAIERKPSRIIRPRLVLYTLLFALLSALWVTGVASRSELDVEVIRDRARLYRVNPAGNIENAYLVRIINRRDSGQEFVLSVAGPESLRIASDSRIWVGPDQARAFPMTLVAAPGSDHRQDVSLTVTAAEDPSLQTRATTRFFFPEEDS